MPEQRSSNEVIVERGYSLSWVNIAEFHERRFVLRLDDDRFTKIILLYLSITIVATSVAHTFGMCSSFSFFFR